MIRRSGARANPGDYVDAWDYACCMGLRSDQRKVPIRSSAPITVAFAAAVSPLRPGPAGLQWSDPGGQCPSAGQRVPDGSPLFGSTQRPSSGVPPLRFQGYPPLDPNSQGVARFPAIEMSQNVTRFRRIQMDQGPDRAKVRSPAPLPRAALVHRPGGLRRSSAPAGSGHRQGFALIGAWPSGRNSLGGGVDE